VQRPRFDAEDLGQQQSGKHGGARAQQLLAGTAVAGRPTGDPARDLLLIISEHAPALEEWQRDIVQIIRMEMLYFLPQMQTKICNEGWASYWHVRIMRELDLTDDEVIAFADLHAGVLQPSPKRINPYFLGYKILEDIERRFSDGGKDLNAARAKLFEVREIENDASLLRNYLTRELCDDLDLYVYGQQGDDVVVTEKEWEKVRDMLVNELTTHGKPLIVADDGDYRGNRELYLKHRFDGQELDLAHAQKTLRHLHLLWGRPVHLETVVKETGWDRVKAVIHCQGSTSFMMSAVAGLAPAAIAVRELARFAAVTLVLPWRRDRPATPNFALALRLRVLAEVAARLPPTLVARYRIGRRAGVDRSVVWSTWAGRA